MPEEFPDDAPEGMVTMAIALPVSFDLYFLPYFPAHVAFMDHAQECEHCHQGAFHPEQWPEDADEEDRFCEKGVALRTEARSAILAQHAASLQN